jgi:hypothetical protein
MRMKIPIGKIAAWIGRTLFAAAAQAVVDRLSQAKPAGEGAEQAPQRKADDQQDLASQ